MERRDKESRQSSLPSSLIPHLYSRPQQPGDTSPTTPFRTALPLPVSPGEEEEAETKELPSMRSTFNLPPVISSFAATSLLDDLRHSPRYLNYESRSVPNEHNSDLTASPPDNSSSAIARSLGSLYIPSHVPRQQRYVSPISSDPIYHTPRPQRPHELTSSFLLPAPQDHPRGTWREGEAGPSSLIHATRDQGKGRSRRGSSQPAQFKPRAESRHRGDESDGEGYSMGAREHEMEGFRGGVGSSHPCTPLYMSPLRQSTNFGDRSEVASLYGSQWALETHPDTRHGSRPSLISERSLPYLPPTHNSFPLTSIGAPRRTWSGSMPGGGGSFEAADFPLAYSPGSISEMSSDARPDDEGDEEFGANQKGIKRGRGSDGAEGNPRKSRNPRKTAVACNFCRGEWSRLRALFCILESLMAKRTGRKLRCNGAKPSCYNCAVRKFQCEYVPVQRRRGPGKAPKGSKSKKGGRSESSTSLPPSDRTSSLIQQEGFPTEYPPHSSVISLENFSFQTTETMPEYGHGRSPVLGAQQQDDQSPGYSSLEPGSKEGRRY
jgi:hypothetical protein